MKQALLPYLAALLSFLCSCSHSEDVDPWEQAVESFSIANFNWAYPKAASYVTDISQPLLCYAASQVTQEDVELLNAKAERATVEVMPDAEIVNDSCVVAMVLVRNFLDMDSIDRPSVLCEEASFHLNAVRVNGRWAVHLPSLPRRER